ncbi:sporulation integral membrane protein YlbJ [Halobacteroides halobius DSM 5150]|uniref:Sporulation integral membrane protein YlbJ n=1 Tax=Halobacteroides halobius (strain ATCC 35273 / DSM 5150 / MD-1) TaxID=748449 RepID=L0KAN4_HALHC|nr:sporulation integral membrane protein YlbJ [Halobacteroides halobius]AGB41158.1 sporulation integral membrane protein YlbJ [Halobacteroides halobius DSM 5150]
MNKKLINLKALIAILFTVALIVFSEPAFNSAIDGLETWWEIVFPALLPFFIVAEILMGLGVVHFMGALLEPLMRPLFRIPGVGAFAVAIGLASGYPIGAKITGNLRREGLCTKTEGERLVSFANTADPLFMIGAVAVGMFSNPQLGAILSLAHYASCLIVGFVLRFYKPNATPKTDNSSPQQENIISYAFNELYNARKKDGRPFGQLLGDSIEESVKTLLTVGGFIIFFSVVTKILYLVGFNQLIAFILTFILEPLGFNQALISPIISGLFELTNGSYLASQANAPLNQQVIITSAIIAWSGLSVHAQVVAMVKGTDIKLKLYFFARILHAILAGALTYFLFDPLNAISSRLTIPVISTQSTGFSLGYLDYLAHMSIGLILLFGFLTFISLTFYIIKQLKVISFHHFK